MTDEPTAAFEAGPIIDEALEDAGDASDAALALRTRCEDADNWDLAEFIFAELLARGHLMARTGPAS